MTVIREDTIGEAWAKALTLCHEAQHGTLGTSCVSFQSAPPDISACPTAVALDAFLKQRNKSSITTVANTIFPNSLWKQSQGDRTFLYDRYLKMWPHIKHANGNAHGVYFQRLIAYGLDTTGEAINQLEFVLETWNKQNHRFSALQAAITDPRKDLSHARQRGFPCLQQIAFHPKGPKGKEGLEIIAFYATQLLIEKGYGNYLGLYRLGQFMASQMGLTLSSVSCVAGSLKLNESCTKGATRPLLKQVSGVPDVEEE